MIAKSIINAVLKSAKPEAKDKLIELVLNYINDRYDYYDKKVAHLLEMLVDEKAFIHDNEIDLNYIKNNLNLLMYNPKDYEIRDIKIERVDNIDCVVIVSYRCISLTDAADGKTEFIGSKANISFVDYPEMLKKS